MLGRLATKERMLSMRTLPRSQPSLTDGCLVVPFCEEPEVGPAIELLGAPFGG